MSEEKIWPSLPEVRPPSPLLVPNTPWLTHSRQTFAVTYLFRTSGQVLGVSLSGALLQAVLTNKLRERITGPGAIEVCISRLRAFPLRLNTDSIFFSHPYRLSRASGTHTPSSFFPAIYNSLIVNRRRHSTTIIPELPLNLQRAAVNSYADALRVVFICQAALNVICFLCCIPIQENTLPYVTSVYKLL